MNLGNQTLLINRDSFSYLRDKDKKLLLNHKCSVKKNAYLLYRLMKVFINLVRYKKPTLT